MTREQQLVILDHHFRDCIKRWKQELPADSDDKKPYINAIYEIPIADPTCPNGERFDKKVREEFIQNKFMECYGKEWGTVLSENAT